VGLEPRLAFLRAHRKPAGASRDCGTSPLPPPPALTTAGLYRQAEKSIATSLLHSATNMRLIHNWRQIPTLQDFKPYLSPITTGLTSLYLSTALPTEEHANQAHCFQTVGHWYLVELC